MENTFDPQVVRYDPDTGAETPVCPTTLYSTTDIDISDTGLLYLAGYFWETTPYRAVVEIDPDDCSQRTVVTEETGFPYTDLSGIAVDQDGDLVVTIGNQPIVIAIDPETGAHSVITQEGWLASSLTGVDVGPTGDIFVTADTGPAFLDAVVRIDPVTGDQTRISFSPGGDNDEMVSPNDIVVGPDGRVFVFDVRYRGAGLEREVRIIEIDPVTGAQTMRTDAGVGTDTGFSNYRGVGISNSGRIVYFIDFSVSPGGNSGVSKIDFDGTPAGGGQYFRERVNAAGTTLSFAGHGLTVVPPPPQPIFDDVPFDYWAYSFIEALARSGITGGCGGNNYCPGDQVTRAQMAVFLLRAKYGAAHVPPPPTGRFDDVGPGFWAASWIEQLADEGITGGCGGNNYCPNSPVTRAQMAVFLIRTFQPDAPAAPSNLSATNNLFTSGVNLSWTDNSGNETAFVIERSLDSGSGYQQIASVGAGETSYTDNSVAGSTTYYYRVAAANNFGRSGYAGPVSILTIARADPAPVLSTSTPSSTGNISLTWTYGWPGGLGSTENGYALEESTSPTSGFVQIYSTVNGGDRESPKTYNFTRTQPGTYTLYYRVRARLNASWSDYSNVVAVNVSISTNTVAEYYPALDNVVQINSLDPSVANTAFPTADLGIGCNWVYNVVPGTQDFLCFTSLLWFDVNTDIDGRQINSAQLYIYPYVLPAAFTQYQLWATFDPWNANVTWNMLSNMRVYAGSGIVFSQPSSTLPIVLDVTTIVQNWATGGWNNYGFWLEDTNYGFPYNTLFRATGFCSNEYNAVCGGPGGRPRLVIDYQ